MEGDKGIKKIFIGGLRDEVTAEDLADYFRKFGKILSCEVLVNTKTGKSKGYGFIVFASSQSVGEMMKAGPHQIKGLTLDCKPAATKKEMLDQTEQIGKECRKIYVDNLPKHVDKHELERFFSDFGDLEEVTLMHESKTKNSAFAFVKFKEDLPAKQLIDKQIIKFKDTDLMISKALSKNEMRKKKEKEVTPPRVPSKKKRHHQEQQQQPSRMQLVDNPSQTNFAVMKTQANFSIPSFQQFNDNPIYYPRPMQPDLRQRRQPAGSMPYNFQPQDSMHPYQIRPVQTLNNLSSAHPYYPQPVPYQQYPDQSRRFYPGYPVYPQSYGYPPQFSQPQHPPQGYWKHPTASNLPEASNGFRRNSAQGSGNKKRNNSRHMQQASGVSIDANAYNDLKGLTSIIGTAQEFPVMNEVKKVATGTEAFTTNLKSKAMVRQLTNLAEENYEEIPSKEDLSAEELHISDKDDKK